MFPPKYIKSGLILKDKGFKSALRDSSHLGKGHHLRFQSSGLWFTFFLFKSWPLGGFLARWKWMEPSSLPQELRLLLDQQRPSLVCAWAWLGHLGIICCVFVSGHSWKMFGRVRLCEKVTRKEEMMLFFKKKLLSWVKREGKFPSWLYSLHLQRL